MLTCHIFDIYNNGYVNRTYIDMEGPINCFMYTSVMSGYFNYLDFNFKEFWLTAV